MNQITLNTTPETWLLPGAVERLQFARQWSDRQGSQSDALAYQSSFGIVSYSLYPDDQYVKRAIAGLDEIPFYITHSPDKAVLFRSWQTTDGRFRLPDELGGGIYDRLTLEDDKLRAFRHLPDNVVGVWVTTNDNAVDVLKESGIQHVTIASDLIASTHYLKHLW